MLKTFKKSIALLVALVFVLSLVPFSALADTEESEGNYVKLIPSNYGYIRAGTSSDKLTNYYTTPAKPIYTDYAVARHSTDGGRNLKYGVYQFDFSDSYKYFLDPNTQIDLSLREGGYAESATRYGGPYTAYIIPGDYDFAEFSMEYAVGAGILYPWSGRYLIKAENNYEVLAVSSDAKHTATTKYFENLSAPAVKRGLDSGESKVLTILFKADSTSDVYFNAAHADTFLKIKYNPETLDTAILDAYSKELEWTDISSDGMDAVTASTKLPEKFKDINIEWSASENGVIGNDGRIIIGMQKKENVVLTATMSYGNAEPVTKTFTVNIESEAPVIVKVPFTNYAYSRTSAKNNNDAKNTVYKYEIWDDGSNNHAVQTGGVYRAYAQLDLSPYEEILKNPSTEVFMKIRAGGQFSGGKINDFKVVLSNDKADGYSYETLTYNKAIELGFHNNEASGGIAPANRPVLVMKSDATPVPYRTTWPKDSETYPNGVPADKEALLQVLGESATNGLVSLFFEPLNDTQTSVGANHVDTGLYIVYYESEIDNDAYLSELEEEFAWDAITSDSQNIVVNNLPTYYKGADIVWSSAEGYVTSSGELAIPSGASIVEDTITANVSYNGNTFTKEFAVKLCDGSLTVGTPELTVDGGIATGSISATNATAKDATYKLYLAVYSGGEMINLVPVTLTAAKGAVTSETLTANVAEGASVKLLVWAADGKTPVTVAVEK